MMRFMRTTVTLHSNLEQLLRETAARTRRPFKKILNETLRGALEGLPGPAKAGRFVVEARPLCLRVGLAPSGFNRMIDDLEAEAFVEVAGRKPGRRR